MSTGNFCLPNYGFHAFKFTVTAQSYLYVLVHASLSVVSLTDLRLVGTLIDWCIRVFATAFETDGSLWAVPLQRCTGKTGDVIHRAQPQMPVPQLNTTRSRDSVRTNLQLGGGGGVPRAQRTRLSQRPCHQKGNTPSQCKYKVAIQSNIMVSL